MLASATVGDSTYTYKYNQDGIRVEKTVGTKKYEYTLEGNKIVRERILSNNVPEKDSYFYYDANGHVSSANIFVYATDATYEYTFVFRTNIQGDVVEIYADDGTSVVTFTYDAYGNFTETYNTEIADNIRNIASDIPFRYRGYTYDKETGLYYLNSRYYDPKVGRFISVDNQLATNDMNGMNLFAYCGNNPVMRIDPTGQAWWHWLIGAVVVVGCAVAVVVTAGGAAAGVAAVAAVANGTAAATTASTVAAGAFIGSATTYTMAVAAAASTSNSVEEFCDQGSWATVATTALGAFAGGVDAYGLAKNSAATNNIAKTESESTIKNDVVGLKRTGSALKADAHHAFPDIVDNYAGYATKTPIANGTLYQIQGSLNGVSGRFEWIVQNQQVTHRMFIIGGGINGIPILP